MGDIFYDSDADAFTIKEESTHKVEWDAKPKLKRRNFGMRIKKYAAAFLAATTVLGSLAACGKKETSTDPTGTPTNSATTAPTQPAGTTKPTATPIPARDLGGMEIIIGDHWSPEEEPEPSNAQEEATKAYREKIMADYNFKMRQTAVADWGGMTDTCTTSILANAPAAQVFVLDASFVAKPMSNGLFYDLSTLAEFDLSDEKWNQTVIELMTKGSAVYGLAVGKPEARGGLYWNKRLFEEAGLDPNLPYELQKSGQWTWSKFKEICGQLTRDTNADGVPDTYAMANFGPDICKQFITSTGVELVKVENGKFVNNSNSQEVLNALNFLKELGDAGYEMPAPEGAQWDWFKAAFSDAWFAMQFNETYMAGQMWKDMEDDFGFVCCPKPDGSDTYHTYYSDNVVIIPSCYDAETASKIAFAYNLWTNPTPGYEDEGDWKDLYYNNFRDERAVDESIATFWEPGVGLVLHMSLVYNLDTGALFYSYPFRSQTPAEKIEEIQNSWNDAINEANK